MAGGSPQRAAGAIAFAAARDQHACSAGQPRRLDLVLSRKLVWRRSTRADDSTEVAAPRRAGFRISLAGQAARAENYRAGDGAAAEQAGRNPAESAGGSHLRAAVRYERSVGVG